MPATCWSLWSDIAPPSLCRQPNGTGAGRRFDEGRALREFQEPGDPRLAHRLLDPLTIERRNHRLGNRDAAEQGAFGLGDPAADQFSRNGSLAGFQIGDLRADLAVLVGEIAGT